MKTTTQPLVVAHIFGIYAGVAVFRCHDGFTRLVYLPTGQMMAISPHPAKITELTHRFGMAAAQRAGAKLG